MGKKGCMCKELLYTCFKNHFRKYEVLIQCLICTDCKMDTTCIEYVMKLNWVTGFECRLFRVKCVRFPWELQLNDVYSISSISFFLSPFLFSVLLPDTQPKFRHRKQIKENLLTNNVLRTKWQILYKIQSCGNYSRCNST